jgi:hypothetical protein
MEFPKLKTGAVMQYPAQRRLEYRTSVLRFVDGGEQRYRESAKELRRWAIRLDLLDDTEVAGVEEFFEAQQGRFASFPFTDPWDGTTYPSCSLESDEIGAEWQGEGRCRTVVTVIENRPAAG